MTYSGEQTGSHTEWLQWIYIEATDCVADVEHVKHMCMWDISPLPTMYVSHPVIPVIAPFVENMFNRFSGHKFRLGGHKE